MVYSNPLMNGSIRAVCFDVDGTLIDTVQLILQSLRHAYRFGLGREFSDEELRPLIGMPLDPQMRYFDHLSSAPLNHESMAQEEMAYFEANKHLERIVPEAVEALKAAKHSGRKTALVTSKNRAELATTLPRLGVAEQLDAIVGCDDVPRPKPAPDSMQEAMRRLNADPKETILIGDTLYDLRCGREAGARVVAVGWGAGTREELTAFEPEFFFEAPAQLLNWIKELPPIEPHAKKKENRTRAVAASDAR